VSQTLASMDTVTACQIHLSVSATVDSQETSVKNLIALKTHARMAVRVWIWEKQQFASVAPGLLEIFAKDRYHTLS